jgi:hypothetical protein
LTESNYLIKIIQYEKEMKEWEDKSMERVRKKKLVKKIVPKGRRKTRRRKGDKKEKLPEVSTTSVIENGFITLLDLENMEHEGTLVKDEPIGFKEIKEKAENEEQDEGVDIFIEEEIEWV